MTPTQPDPSSDRPSNPDSVSIPVVSGPARGRVVRLPLQPDGTPPADVVLDVDGARVAHEVQRGVYGLECVCSSLEGQQRAQGRHAMGIPPAPN
jgi:hypothetical protein